MQTETVRKKNLFITSVPTHVTAKTFSIVSSINHLVYIRKQKELSSHLINIWLLKLLPSPPVLNMESHRHYSSPHFMTTWPPKIFKSPLSSTTWSPLLDSTLSSGLSNHTLSSRPPPTARYRPTCTAGDWVMSPSEYCDSYRHVNAFSSRQQGSNYN
jgi:hypothetical protein